MKQIYLTLLVALPVLLTAQVPQQAIYPKPAHEQVSLEIEELQLFPNPVTNNVVYITTKNNKSKQIIIYDVFGNAIRRQQMYQKQLELANLRKGVYIIQIIEGNRTSKRKLVIK